jgi:D-alanyl-D-alanine carboxypeptidase/D-alanyl-D-alanine-endopeptidase (penicillin-binding protein 4)
MLSALGPLKISVIDSITLITPETEGPNVPLGLTQDSLPMCYATPIDPFIIDHNCFTVTLDGQKKASQSKDSAIPIHIDDQLRWIAEDHHDCIFEPALHDQTLTLKGCFSGLDRSTLKFALPLTEARLITLFNRQLKALNIAWKGKLSITSTRPTHLGKPLLTHASAPLQDLMKYTLQTSDNLYAEFFLRQLALQAKHPSSFKWGLKALSAQLNMPDLALEDGSGDSHYNLVSSEQLAKLLTRAYHQRDFFPLWLSFLPQAGKTGSLQSFFKNTSLEGKLFAKTGSLIRIHTLAGYFEHHPQHYWVVVIMTFGTDAKSDFYRNVQRLLETR